MDGLARRQVKRGRLNLQYSQLYERYELASTRWGGAIDPSRTGTASESRYRWCPSSLACHRTLYTPAINYSAAASGRAACGGEATEIGEVAMIVGILSDGLPWSVAQMREVAAGLITGGWGPPRAAPPTTGRTSAWAARRRCAQQ